MTMTRKLNVVLWILQGLMAVLFVFAGWTKLVMPAEALEAATGLPGWFMQFIGAAEAIGGLGLLLPGIFRIRRELTPLAAAGLTIIMAGATVTSLMTGAGAASAFPAVIGVLLAVVVRGRAAQHPISFAACFPALARLSQRQPA
jgi:hypothetical protein